MPKILEFVCFIQIGLPIVWAYEDVMGGGTGLDLQRLAPLYRDMQVELRGQVLRRESLALFQQFFRTYDYWQGSLLASYTLEQSL